MVNTQQISFYLNETNGHLDFMKRKFCPKCKSKLRIVVGKMTEDEKEFFRKMGSKILEEHKDVWYLCDNVDCYFVRHETVVGSRVVMSSEFFSEKHVRGIK